MPTALANEDWEAILSHVSSFEAKCRAKGSTAWFRGHRDASWKLQSSLHRYVGRLTADLTPRLSEAERISLLRAEYKTIYREFKGEAWGLLSHHERSDWAVIFTMQHFGIPTRLLDWTESFACALFFAQLERKPGDSASLFMLDGEGLNRVSIGTAARVSLDEDPTAQSVFDPRDWHPKWNAPYRELGTISAAPIYTSPRMVAQRSMFTIMGDTFEPLDQQFAGRLLTENVLVELPLAPATFQKAEDYLRTAGLTAFSFYPDLSGLAMKHILQTEQKLRFARTIFSERFRALNPPGPQFR